MYTSLFKRLIDCLIAITIFAFLLPVFLIIALLLMILNNGKPFFFQPRPGRHGNIFNIIKFKTMNDNRDENGLLLNDTERITPIGTFIRKTSLDELPQLINVIKGDMSLVGPRPLLPQYLPLYDREQKRRHNVRPGITGWAQVNGRNAISWKEKFILDCYYIDHISFGLDLHILYLTFVKVFKREGVNASANTTMEAFNGNN
ncbi:sugar transferase [Pedobacter sp. P26]|uniref:sugar transferase n=1 Tax=Pedobacter sp. P26 TaxID=3423956 RepID=UPI003D66DB6D